MSPDTDRPSASRAVGAWIFTCAALVLAMVVVGGARTLAGSVLGPFVLLALPQILALIDIPTSIAAAARQLIYGLLLIVFMLFRPQGLLGEKL